MRVIPSRVAGRVRPVLGARRLVAALALLGAGVIHAAETRAHLQEWPPEGIFFALVAALQLLLGTALLLRRSPVAAAAAAMLSGFVIAVWLVSRTVGIPLGPHAGVPEIATRADIIATTFELTTVVALALTLIAPLRKRVEPRRRQLPRRAAGFLAAAAAVAALTGFAVGAPDACLQEREDVARANHEPLTPLELLEQHDDHDPYRLNLSPGATVEGSSGNPAAPPGADCHSH